MQKGRSRITLAIILIAAALLPSAPCLANGINVTNVTITGVGGETADIQFDVSWSNSWNLAWSDDGGATTVTNWDAAWVFIKFKTASGNWRQGYLSSSGHTATAGTAIDVGSSGTGTNMGVFVRRNATGSGSLVAQGIKLKWDFAKSGLGGTNDVDISVHAIEMVYVPTGPFALGSGGAESGHFYKYPTISDTYTVASEDAIPSDNGVAGHLYENGGYYNGTILPAFPKGYSAFYCMKYELSQGQYASFLNQLESGEADARYPTNYLSSRYTIMVVSNQYSATAPDRACNFLSIADVSAYLDWSGLRPMSELEYEKACRGSLPPEPNECPWGTITITKFVSFSGVDGSGSETALPASANCHFNGGGGPIRVGIFAESGSTRQKSGASYYGIMDLAGNVSECAVCVNVGGIPFAASHGDGVVGTQPADWPGYDGYIRRGGSWADASTALSTSCRTTAADSTRNAAYGGRGVRTAQP